MSKIINTALLIGNKCNQNCLHCYYTNSKDSHTENYNKEKISRIFEYFNRTKIFNNWVYIKEPSTDIQLLEVISKLKEKQNTIFTNGSSKKKSMDKFYSKCKEIGIEQIHFSLHGLQNDHCYITGTDAATYKRIINNIRRAIEMDFRVEIFCTVNHRNIKKLEDFIFFCNSLNIPRINFVRFLPLGKAKVHANEFLLTKKDFEFFVEKIESLKESGQIENTRLSPGISFGPNMFAKNLIKFINKPYSYNWPKSKYFCPVVENNLWAVNLNQKSIHWCFLVQSDKDTRIGDVYNTQKGEIEFEMNRDRIDKKKIGEEIRWSV